MRTGTFAGALASHLARPSKLDTERIIELLPRFLTDSFYWVPREALSSLEKLLRNGRVQLPELCSLLSSVRVRMTRMLR